MRQLLFAQLALGATLGSWACGALGAAAPEPDIRKDATVSAVERVMPAVVNVGTETVVEQSRTPIDDLFREFFDPYNRGREQDTTYSIGSGVIIDEEGHVLTNHHVVSRAHRVTVKLMDGREFEARPLTSTAFTDIALLKIIAKPGEKFASVKFGGDDDLLLGETVIALGNPFGLGGSVSRGILSSKARRPPNKEEALDIPDWLQIDASINPGNSGGPLVNLRGDLIGINVAVSRQGQGIGFAIPIKRISATISEMYTPETLGGFWFGARMRPQQRPPRVAELESGSPAAIAGIREADWITAVDGQLTRSLFHLVDELVKVGDKRDVELGIQRGSERFTTRIHLVKEQSYFNADLIRSRLGVRVDELSAAAAARLGLDVAGGLLVNSVEANSPASAAEIQRGMIITAMDGQKTSRVGRAAKIIHAKERGKTVKLDLIVPWQRGRFVQVQAATVEMKTR
ncbi:MAG: trypsin-like peptidase domain-containing protein [Verrucomicrobia bacterium]|nr:trypsin-like peptidase domain-containing protein [Verrucomicrobiota bacterium]MBI3868247.1 trypsin-like peptidase domain-containing protein [Verrucomicrobiota bacterium]